MLPFTKVQGLGNDFVVVDLRPGRPGTQSGSDPSPQDPDVVRAICDRHFGVGADGVLAILPILPGLPGAGGDARMRVLNADGSEAEMCGNGIRCVAKVLYESDPALRRAVLRIDTGAGLLECALDVSAGEVRSVSVNMGRARTARNEIPLAPGGSGRAVREPISALGRAFAFTAVSMGNPHAVIFIDSDDNLRALAEQYGPVLEVAPLFPRRANIEFARVRGGVGADAQEIDVVVWERGVGITLACGTGACATAVAACIEERLPRGQELRVHLPGGPLAITVPPENGDGDGNGAGDGGVIMRGPATTVFRAELDLATLAVRRA